MAVANPWDPGSNNENYWNQPEGTTQSPNASMQSWNLPDTSAAGTGSSPLAGAQGWRAPINTATAPTTSFNAYNPVGVNGGMGVPSGGVASATPAAAQSPGTGTNSGGASSTSSAAQQWADAQNTMLRQRGLPGAYTAAQYPGNIPGVTVGAAAPGQNFWQPITGSINGSATNLAPGLTQGSAQGLASRYGGNAVAQNITNMASPGSTAPSAARYGLDFGYGDVQDAEQVARWEARGDSEDQIRQRLTAGLNNTGWGGPAPQVNQSVMWDVPQGDRSNPAGTPSPFGNAQHQANLAGRGNYGASAGPSMQPGQYNLGTPPTASGNDQASVMAFLSQLLGPQFLASLMSQGQPQNLGNTTRRAPLTQARNTAFQRDMYYPRTEPRLY